MDRLISGVQRFPFLYNGSKANFKNRETIEAAWKEISDETGYTETECRERWHNLRSNYMRERKKKLMAASLDASNPSKPKWIYFTAMSFLEEHIVARKNSTPIKLPMENSNSTTGPEEAEEAEAEPETNQIKRVKLEVDDPEGTTTTTTTTNEIPNQLPNFWHHPAEQEYDSDKMFLLSLLPVMKRLTDLDNIDFRIEVQQILRQKLSNSAYRATH